MKSFRTSITIEPHLRAYPTVIGLFIIYIENEAFIFNVLLLQHIRSIGIMQYFIIVKMHNHFNDTHKNTYLLIQKQTKLLWLKPWLMPLGRHGMK